MNEYSYQYYVEDESPVPDSHYDTLYLELKQLESTFPNAILPESPTQRVSDKLKGGFEKYRHTAAMLSLDNAFTDEDMQKQFEICKAAGSNMSAEIKADGLALSAHYENGYLTRVVTRGDGAEGEVVTHTAKTIKNLPIRLRSSNPPAFLEVRGEAAMPLIAFAAYNERAEKAGTKTLTNPRNGAAGAIRNLEPFKAAERDLCFMAYAIGSMSDDVPTPQSQNDLYEMFHEWGFSYSEYVTECATFEDCKAVYTHILENRDKFSIAIDGIVFKSSLFSVREQLGNTNHHPRWAIAWKLPAEEKVTKLLDVYYQTGRTGIITPIASISPVFVGGVTISSTTLFNEEHLTKRLGLRYGDDIIVFRAGDVVPQTKCRIDSPHQADARPYVFTSQCPSCGGAITKRGESWFCMDVLNCPAQITNRIVRATGRDCLDIDSFGAKLAESLVEVGLITGYDEIFTLAKHRDDLVAMEGYGTKSVDKLLEAIEKAKHVPLDRFIYLLGINEIGRSLSRVLANKYRSIEALANASYTDLLSTDDVGEVTASSIVEYFSSADNMQLIEKLVAVGVKIIAPEVIDLDEMAVNYTGKTFVVTGTFSGISRSEIENFIKAHGGKVSGSPSPKTFATIVGDKAGSKLQKSIELKLPIVTDADIVRITGNDISKLPDALLVNASFQAA